MRRVAVIGTGHTKFMFNSTKTSMEMLAEASMDAILSSKLKPRMYRQSISKRTGDFSEGQGMVQSFLADDIGCRNVPATRFEGACASATMAIRDAFMWWRRVSTTSFSPAAPKEHAMGRPWRRGLSLCSATAVMNFRQALRFPGLCHADTPLLS